jgi:hypothetical protein
MCLPDGDLQEPEAANDCLLRSPYKDFPAFFEYFNALIFGTDTVLSFFRYDHFPHHRLRSPHVKAVMTQRLRVHSLELSGLHLCRCYYDQEVLITDRKLIAYHYLKYVLVNFR